MEWLYEEGRIYSLDEEGDILVEVSFPLVKENLVDIDSTYVSPKARGKGYAGMALELAAKHIREKGYKTLYSCPYAEKWFIRNREKYGDLMGE